MQEAIFTESHLTAEALACRWSMTPHTLGQWRWKGHGPRFFKLGGKVLYRHEEIDKFETYSSQLTTADAEDLRFLCIDLESLIATKEEEKVMDP